MSPDLDANPDYDQHTFLQYVLAGGPFKDMVR
jgi:hypothetical protein